MIKNQLNYKQRQNMIVKLIYVIQDCGDGSSRNSYFESVDKAEEYIEKNDWYGIIPEGVEVDTFTLLPNGILKPTSGFDEYESY